MSYFSVRVGLRPASGTESGKQGPETEGQSPSGGDRKLALCFTAQVGPQFRPDRFSKPVRPLPQAIEKTPKSEMACPLCRGVLHKEGGLYHCTGRCGARWLEEAPGHLVDVAALPFGICVCCEGPQSLVQGGVGALCPTTGREYLLLPEGPVLRDVGAPHGVCQCCIPPMPFVQRDDELVCRGKPHNHYERVGDEVRLVSMPTGSPTPTETLEAIDTALSQNSARLTTYGLFDVEW